MRGREREWDIVLDLLSQPGQARGDVMLVEGEPGIGKSLLLSEAADEAARRGFIVKTAAADWLGSLMPLAPLFAALQDPGGWVGEVAAPGLSEMRMWLANRLRRRLEELTESAPVLVGLDDLQWADRATLLALRILPGQLASHPVAWLLVRSTGDDPSGADRLFSLLLGDGALRVGLGALRQDAVASLTADALGAVPDAGLLELARDAGGNPLLVTELMTGLRDEGAVRITDGHAALGLPEASLPGRVGTVVQRRLDRLSPAARNLIQMAAVLGRSFALYDAAEMLDEPPAVLLPLVQEAVAGDVLAATQDAIIFRHELVRRAVTETLPQPLVQALHRQFGEILIQRGSSAIPAAGHLAAGGRRGDTLALAGLDRAARELLPASPHAAADLARRALDLTHPADPARFARSVAAIDALTAAGRLDAAAHLLHAELAQPLPAMDKAKLRGAWSSVLYLSGHPAAARAEAEAVLAEPRLPASLRDQTNVALLQARAGARDNQAVSDLADAILAAPAEHGYDAKVTAMTVLGVTKWDQGQMAEGLKLCREAARQTARGSVDARRFHPQLTLAARLIDARQLDDAAAVIQLASRHIEAAGHSVWAPVPAELRARIDLVQGRLDAANADAQAALRIAEEFETHIYDQLPLMVLATVALRRGDLGAAELHLRKADAARAPALGEAYTDQRRTILAAQIAEAQDGPQAALALALATGVYEDLRRHRWPLYEPVTAAWLVRVALAADDRDRAATAAAVAADIAADNPGYPVLTAVGDHARGLLDHDLARLEQAARHHVDVWARASAAEDVALLLAADRDTSSAIIRLDEALNGYERTGATRDAARVRRRLRQVGARRRHWASAKRPVTGWTTLTSTERAISLLAAQGLTNQQIANQKFISVHTVAFHLRQIFRKLGIGSRVELARVAVQHDQTQE